MNNLFFSVLFICFFQRHKDTNINIYVIMKLLIKLFVVDSYYYLKC